MVVIIPSQGCSHVTRTQLLIKSGVYFVQPLQRCGYYSRAATKQGQCLITEIWYKLLQYILTLELSSEMVV